MKICLTDQKQKFDYHLRRLMKTPVMPYDRSTLNEKITTINLEPKKEIEGLDLAFLFDYHIFPPNIMIFLTQWEMEKRQMNQGDTILQQVFIPPTRTFSQKIIFGVRVNSIINESKRKGFSYETLEGHVEKGESTFTVEQDKEGLIFKVQTFSSPGNLLAKLAGPIFSIPYQAYCTQKALENVRKQIHSLG